MRESKETRIYLLRLPFGKRNLLVKKAKATITPIVINNEKSMSFR